MTIALLEKNTLGFVDGSMSMPTNSSTDLKNWKRCNVMVCGYLVSSMDKEIKSSFKYANTTCDI